MVSALTSEKDNERVFRS